MICPTFSSWQHELATIWYFYTLKLRLLYTHIKLQASLEAQLKQPDTPFAKFYNSWQHVWKMKEQAKIAVIFVVGQWVGVTEWLGISKIMRLGLNLFSEYGSPANQTFRHAGRLTVNLYLLLLFTGLFQYVLRLNDWNEYHFCRAISRVAK